MAFVTDLDTWIREHRPGWETTVSEDGRTLRIEPRDGEPLDGEPQDRGPGEALEADDLPAVDDAPDFHVREEEASILLDWAWKLPLKEGKAEELRDLVVEYVDEALENHGWEVPVVLQGGPLHGKRLTKPRDDLIGRLMFARKGASPEASHHAELYKWRLKRNDKGEYVCVYERSLHGDEVDRFIARGVESTGPFVLIHDPADRAQP